MSYVLAIEPNEGQARLLRDAVRFRAKTKLLVVESIDAAAAALGEEIPRLVLITALMPPRDEIALVSRLRSLPRESAPEVLIIPRLAMIESDKPVASLLGRFRRRALEPSGCDPLAFADQLLHYLSQSGERSREALARDRRIYVRYDRLEWATAVVDDVEVRLIDLSASGVQFLTPRVMLPKTHVRVRLSSDRDLVLCEGRVVWSGIEAIGAGTDACYRAGVTFTEAYRTAVERFCLREERTLIA